MADEVQYQVLNRFVYSLHSTGNLFSMSLQTDRLLLRPWKESDLEPFAAMNADPTVMECFPSTLARQQNDALAERQQAFIEERGWGLWAVSVLGGADFIGFIGLIYWDKESLPTHFTPATEVGWRLAAEHWGKGYATEGARAALAFAFEQLELDEVVSMTAKKNTRSIAVMQRLGMHHDPKDDFSHPKLPKDHPLSPHVLYRISPQT
jgi:3-dehydroquinate dehydratase/shikimate dehydrogenase